MCRNIKTLYHYDPPVTDEEIRAAAPQYVRKISGFNKPSKANQAAFQAAVEAVTAVSTTLLNELETDAPLRNRAKETAAAQAQSIQRFPSKR